MFLKRRDFLLGSTAFLGSFYFLQKSSEELVAMADSSAIETIKINKADKFYFNSKATDYNAENSYSLALISQLVYRKFDKDPAEKLAVQETAKNWGYDDVYFFHNEYEEVGKKKDSEAIILVNSDSIIVAFRGSETDPEDWKNNAKFKKEEYLGGHVHRGFLKAFTDVWYVKDDDTQVKMEDRLRKEMQGNKRTLWITGHSLGGAMAILAAASCKLSDSNHLEVSGVYTYGQPRVGDLNFEAVFDPQLKTKTFRVVNNNDIVARIPNINYEHVGTLKFINSSGNVINEEALSWLQKTSSRVIGRFHDFGKSGTDGINDHRLNEEYIPKLKAQLSTRSTV
ncbi:lipase family protein [Acaryochloris sp. IP29b_bin.137]|uniref:lipase family protein n=1 Tax=Acaryochloris sp. IP29b_bin.137 TaxID=2969217 RepID=UPI00262541F4|nr:lipase family protein [Acaryochloris sp. IP29b_bin.137]